ncbi:Tesmin/TSO1-like CXC domain protein, partial [Teladorsagia circumcincta]
RITPIVVILGVKSGKVDAERLHQKGCHCKKSGCLKNYCECFEAKVPCTSRCKCHGCQNTEGDRANRNDRCSYQKATKSLWKEHFNWRRKLLITMKFP